MPKTTNFKLKVSLLMFKNSTAAKRIKWINFYLIWKKTADLMPRIKNFLRLSKPVIIKNF